MERLLRLDLRRHRRLVWIDDRLDQAGSGRGERLAELTGASGRIVAPDRAEAATFGALGEIHGLQIADELKIAADSTPLPLSHTAAVARDAVRTTNGRVG